VAALCGDKLATKYEAAVQGVAKAVASNDKKTEAGMKLVVAELGGSSAKSSGDFEEALAKAEEALSTFQDTKDKSMEACAQLVISSLNCRRQRAIEAQQAANAALTTFMDIDDKKGQAQAFHALALSSLISDEFDSAIKSSKAALAIYKELGLKWAQVVELYQMAQWYMIQDKPQKSLKLAKDALAVARGLDCSKRFEASLLMVLGQALIADGHGKRAQKAVREGLELLSKSGDKSGALAGQLVLMQVLIMLEAPKDALEAAYEAKELLNQIPSAESKQCEIDYLHLKAKALVANDEKDLAASALRDAAQIAKDLNDSEEEAEAMKAIALVYGKGPAMESAADEARSICNDASDVYGEASALLLKGSLLLKNNANADEILGEVEEARNLCQEVEDIVGEAAALKMMIDCYVGKEDFESAMEAASDCVELHKQLGKKQAQAEAMCSIVNIHLQEGESEEIYDVIDEGTALAKEVGATALEARFSLLLAQVCVAALQKEDVPKSKTTPPSASYNELREKALKATKNALLLSGKCGDRGTRASASFWHAEVLVWCFRSGEAEPYAKDAENLFAKLDDLRGQAHAQVLLGDLQLMNGQKEASKALAEKTLAMVKGKAGCEDAEKAVNQLLERIKEKERVPVMSGGKRMVQKMVKKRRKKGGGGGAVATGGIDKAAAIAKVLELAKNAVSGDDEMQADVPFMEAGIDSLGSVQFVTDASREFSMTLPPSVVIDYPTVRSLA
jgi:tetratricopeptide (TPR) repeat protein